MATITMTATTTAIRIPTIMFEPERAPESALDPEALYTLAAWSSPAFPVGAFAYSHGLEWAVGARRVCDPATLEAWARDCVLYGAGRSDGVLLAAAWRAARGRDAAALAEIADLAAALAPTPERRLETLAQGAAFLAAVADGWGVAPAGLGREAAYPVAVGAAAGARGLPLGPTLVLSIQAFAAMLVSAAVRLVPIGQTDGQRVLAALSPDVRAAAAAAEAAEREDIGGAALLSDIAAMRHETQTETGGVRLFRS